MAGCVGAAGFLCLNAEAERLWVVSLLERTHASTRRGPTAILLCVVAIAVLVLSSARTRRPRPAAF